MKGSIHKLLYRDALLCTLMTFIVAGLLYFTFVNLSILDPFEKAFKDFKFTDMYYSERFNETQRNNKIVLVNIKHADRFQLAQAIEKIAEQKPKVIGLDIIFKERKLEFTDSILKNVLLSNNDNIVSAYFHDEDSIVNSNDYFKTDNQIKGYINLNLNGQNTVIRDFIGVKGDNDKEFAFATQLALASGYIDEAYALKELKNPIPINYIGNKDVFLNFDIDEISNLNEIPAIKDAVVILGYLGDGNEQFDIEDKHFTPLNKDSVGRAVPDTYGVTVHANILNMLSKQNLIYRVSTVGTYLIAFVFCFFIIVMGIKLYKRSNFMFDFTEKVIQLLLSVLLLLLALLLLQSNIYINMVPVILLSLLSIEMVCYYEYLVKYLNKKFKWKSYLL